MEILVLKNRQAKDSALIRFENNYFVGNWAIQTAILIEVVDQPEPSVQYLDSGQVVKKTAILIEVGDQSEPSVQYLDR